MAVTLPIPAGTALITDDGCATGLKLIDITTGEIIGFTDLADFACGSESGIAMPDGTIGTPNNSGGAGDGIFAIYDGDLNLIVNAIIGNPSIEFVEPVGTTAFGSTYFYVISADISDNLTLNKVDKAGNTIDTWDLATTTALNPTPCAVDRNDAFFYFESSLTGEVKRLDLNTDAISVVATLGIFTFIGVGADGNIYVNRDSGGTPKIEKYNTSFALISSVDGGPATYSIDRAHFHPDDLHIVTWVQKNSGIAHPSEYSIFRKIRLSDLSVISDSPNIPTESNSSFIGDDEISNCCPLLISGDNPSSDGRDDCPGGSLPGGDGGNGGSWCIGCDPIVAGPPQNWPPALLADLLSVGINNCWNITFIYAVEPLFNARGFTAQHDSSGKLRGRFYEGFPVPNFAHYFDTNGPNCEWLYSPHGI